MGKTKERDEFGEILDAGKGYTPGSDKVKIYELPGLEQAACTIYKGPYDNIGEAYTAIMSWTQANGYAIAGQDREIYLASPYETKDAAKYITEVQFTVKKQ